MASLPASPGFTLEPFAQSALPVTGARRYAFPEARMQRKIFWITFAALGLVADLLLPFWWAVVATAPILALSWWIAYRSDWF